MKRAVIVALAVVMSVLVATAPVAASHTLAVASIHTTDTDFNNGSLTNMTVTGSGESATVGLNPTESTTYSVVNDSGDGAVDGQQPFVGDTAGDAVINSEMKTVPNTTGTVENITVIKDSTLGSDYDFVVDIFAVQEDPDGTYGEGTKIVEDWDPSFSQGAETVELDTTFDVSSGETWTIEFVTNTSDNDGSGDSIRVETDDSFNSAWFSREGSTFDRGANLNLTIQSGGEAPGTYISQNHTAEDSEQGFVNITEITNATATVTWETNDGTGWSQLNQTSGITTAANHTFTWSTESNDTVRVNVTVFNESGNGVPEFTMVDEGVQFTANDTFVDNSSASPTGELSTATPTLEIDANDSDFDLAQGDSVEVEFFVDGESIGTDTLTANGTASQSVSDALDGGDHTWNVTATDDYGHSVDSQEFTISTVGNVTFRRETPEHPIIDDRQINGTIFGEDDDDQFVMNFTTSDGNVSLTGVPVDERLVVQVEADGYHPREVVIEDVFSQTNMYLLNTSESSVDVTFDIQDTTGDFSAADTEFVIQRQINRSLFDSGGFTNEAIAGDRIGAATEYTTTLEQDGRYRIIIRNPGVSTRVLGAQVAKSDSTIPIRINSVDLDVNETQGFNWSAKIIESGGNDFVEFTYVDNEDQTTSVDLVIYEFGNASNEIHNQTHTGTYGTLRVTEQLTGDQPNKTWAVQFDSNRGDGESGTVVIGQDTDPLGVPLDDEWKYRISLLSLVVVGFIVGGGVSPEAGGIAIVATAGMWLYIGWMPAEVTGVAVGFGALTAVGFAIGKRGGEPVQ